MSTEGLIIIVLLIAGIGVAIYFFMSRRNVSNMESCAELEAALQAEVNKPNGGDVQKIAEIRNRLSLNCGRNTASQAPIKSPSGEVFLPYNVETECSALVTSYMQEYRALQSINWDPLQGSNKGNHMRSLLSEIRTCYQDALANADETTINGLIESVKKAIRDISSTKQCFKSGPCQGGHVNIHGDNFIQYDIEPTLETLRQVQNFAEARRRDLIRAMGGNS